MHLSITAEVIRKVLKTLEGGSFTRNQAVVAQQLLSPHHIEHENLLAIETVENPARGLDDLAIARATKLGRLAAAFRMGVELLELREYPPDPFGGSPCRAGFSS